jgi:hypothetical protein
LFIHYYHLLGIEKQTTMTALDSFVLTVKQKIPLTTSMTWELFLE